MTDQARRFVDAALSVRCAANIRLRDGSSAQCGRRRVELGFCRQHWRMFQRGRIERVHVQGHEAHTVSAKAIS
jgi:hypothetical protein